MRCAPFRLLCCVAKAGTVRRVMTGQRHRHWGVDDLQADAEGVVVMARVHGFYRKGSAFLFQQTLFDRQQDPFGDERRFGDQEGDAIAENRERGK